MSATVGNLPPINATLYQPRAVIAGVDVRPMRAEDEAVFRRLYAEMRAPELSITPWSASEKQVFCDAQYTLQDQHYRQYYPDFEAWAICSQAAVIGRLYFATFEGLWMLMDITLAARSRGKGIGSQLLRDVTRHADEKERVMSLHVEPENPARRLYRRLGFVEIAVGNSDAAENGDSGFYLEMRRVPRAPET